MYIRAPQPPAFAYYQPALLAHVRAQHHKPLQVQIYRPVAYFASAGECAYRPPEAPQQRPQHEYTRSYLLADALRHYAALGLCRIYMRRACFKRAAYAQRAQYFEHIFNIAQMWAIGQLHRAPCNKRCGQYGQRRVLRARYARRTNYLSSAGNQNGCHLFLLPA